MIEAAVIADSSPLIGLARIGQIDLLKRLARRVVVPAVVWSEVTQLPNLPGASVVLACQWIEIAPPNDGPDQNPFVQLDPGESAALQLAQTIPGSLLLLDDDQARRVARRLGLRMTGTIGLLCRAKTAGLITAVKPHVNALLANGIYIHPQLIADVLRDVGENT
ncbi:MAG: DUF3368 domain-containing protein [Verrucomicrobia bacterium]|nr:DUF3368 domain-containing protein [Verrucomicrobiota bacterium]